MKGWAGILWVTSSLLPGVYEYVSPCSLVFELLCSCLEQLLQEKHRRLTTSTMACAAGGDICKRRVSLASGPAARSL